MPLMRANKTFKIDRNRFVAPGEQYDCTEGVARSHEAMGHGERVGGNVVTLTATAPAPVAAVAAAA